MKTRLLLILLLGGAIVAASACAGDEQTATGTSPQQSTTTQPPSQQSAQQSVPPGGAQAGAAASSSNSPATSASTAPAMSREHAMDAHGMSHASQAGEVPAFQTDAASLASLPPTLAPQLFSGKQQLAYAVVREIPQTIAQLPCYCHCDRGFGHKSLHTCYVDEHAAHCAVCVDEALLAYRLQKEEKLSPAQIRERIVAIYGAE